LSGHLASLAGIVLGRKTAWATAKLRLSELFHFPSHTKVAACAEAFINKDLKVFPFLPATLK